MTDKKRGEHKKIGFTEGWGARAKQLQDLYDHD